MTVKEKEEVMKRNIFGDVIKRKSGEMYKKALERILKRQKKMQSEGNKDESQKIRKK